jgi:hypothetical protein
MCSIGMENPTSTRNIETISITRCYCGMVSNCFEFRNHISYSSMSKGIFQKLEGSVPAAFLLISELGKLGFLSVCSVAWLSLILFYFEQFTYLTALSHVFNLFACLLRIPFFFSSSIS